MTKKTTTPKTMTNAAYRAAVSAIVTGPRPFVIGQRTVDSDRMARNDFQYPRRGWVTAPDWNDRPACGGGLHFVAISGPSVQGNESLLDRGPGTIYQTVLAFADECVCIDGRHDGKYKAKRLFVMDDTVDQSAFAISHGAAPNNARLKFTGHGGYGEIRRVSVGDDSTILSADSDIRITAGDHVHVVGRRVYGDFGHSAKIDAYRINVSAGDWIIARSKDSARIFAHDGRVLCGDRSRIEFTGDGRNRVVCGEESTVRVEDTAIIRAGPGSSILISPLSRSGTAVVECGRMSRVFSFATSTKIRAAEKSEITIHGGATIDAGIRVRINGKPPTDHPGLFVVKNGRVHEVTMSDTISAIRADINQSISELDIMAEQFNTMFAEGWTNQ